MENDPRTGDATAMTTDGARGPLVAGRAASFSATVLVASSDAAAMALALTTLMGWSRVSLGHHYATDVVAGAILGAAAAAPIAAIVM
ncbi:MAG TPA: phosphatase PAP2 family protein [Thermoanaerobaculia bacterium]|nr:phosphatase PAP2 family protein [Thermoanaerobaculia bacterium]